MVTVADLLNRVRQEYTEMPGLVLTSRQAGRLWNLDPGMCEALLSRLVHEEFLSQTRGGAYLRRGQVCQKSQNSIPTSSSNITINSATASRSFRCRSR